LHQTLRQNPPWIIENYIDLVNTHITVIVNSSLSDESKRVLSPLKKEADRSIWLLPPSNCIIDK